MAKKCDAFHVYLDTKSYGGVLAICPARVERWSAAVDRGVSVTYD
jgi:hypothetical protein